MLKLLYQLLKRIASGPGRVLPDKIYLQIRYFLTFGKCINYRNPKSFNEKLQWLKVYYKDSLFPKIVDKYAVRKFVTEKIGEQYLIPLYGKWSNAEEIPVDLLPEKFVLKCTHDCGSVVICKDKAAMDWPAILESLKKGLKDKSCYWDGREWPYRYVNPNIVAEMLLGEEDSDLFDYKFFCFDGKVKCYKVDFDRFTEHKANYFDLDKKLLPFGEEKVPPDWNKKLEMPENIDEMIHLAEVLAEGIPFVRVDLYNVHGKIYFGEMTLFPACGFERILPQEWEYTLGEWLQLPEKKKERIERNRE